jgi:glycosyltransferase involved in cell wall biosynthesis
MTDTLVHPSVDSRPTPQSTRIGIALPTYRRPEFLARCIRSIIVSGSKYSVPIYVVDDSGDDTNLHVINTLKAEYPHLHHVRNEGNIGIDRNIVKSVNCCLTDYVWIMGEDDLLKPHAIERALDVLENHDYAFVCANYSYISNDQARIIRDKRLDVSDGLIDGNLFIARYLWAIGFIGACIINKERWLQAIPEKYMDTFFAHVGVIVESIAGQSLYIISEPIVLNRAENASSATWSSNAFEVMYGWTELLDRLADVCDTKLILTLRCTSEEIFWHESIPFLLAQRAEQTYNRDKFDRFLRHRNYCPVYKVFALLIAYLPTRPLAALKRAFQRLRS